MTETYDAEKLARRLRICADASSPISAAPELLETSATVLAAQAEEIERLRTRIREILPFTAVEVQLAQSAMDYGIITADDLCAPKDTVMVRVKRKLAEREAALGGKQND